MDRKIVEQLILKKSFNEIERDLPVGKKRIKKIYDLAKAMGYLDGKPLPAYPESIFDPPALGLQYQFQVSFLWSTLIGSERAPLARVVPEIIHAPGESLLLDWGKLCDVTDPETGMKKTLWFLAGIMGHSRYMMVRLVWDNKLSTTLNALESMFNEVGGVPAKLTSDNPKCFATETSMFEQILNPGFERFCSHYAKTYQRH